MHFGRPGLSFRWDSADANTFTSSLDYNDVLYILRCLQTFGFSLDAHESDSFVIPYDNFPVAEIQSKVQLKLSEVRDESQTGRKLLPWQWRYVSRVV